MTDRKKRHQIAINQDSGVMEIIEVYKERLGMKSNEEVLAHFLPETDEEFFDHEWQSFKKRISKCIPDNNNRHHFLTSLEALFYIGIVNGNKVSSEFIDNFKEEFGDE